MYFGYVIRYNVVFLKYGIISSSHKNKGHKNIIKSVKITKTGYNLEKILYGNARLK